MAVPWAGQPCLSATAQAGSSCTGYDSLDVGGQVSPACLLRGHVPHAHLPHHASHVLRPHVLHHAVQGVCHGRVLEGLGHFCHVRLPWRPRGTCTDQVKVNAAAGSCMSPMVGRSRGAQRDLCASEARSAAGVTGEQWAEGPARRLVDTHHQASSFQGRRKKAVWGQPSCLPPTLHAAMLSTQDMALQTSEPR